MNFLKRKTTWTNLEFVPVKLAIASVYLLLGARFHQFFSQWYVPLIVLFAVSVFWALYLWITKMRRNR